MMSVSDIEWERAMSMLKKIILACVIAMVVGYGGIIAYKIVTHTI